jgi:hypothetical protein
MYLEALVLLDTRSFTRFYMLEHFSLCDAGTCLIKFINCVIQFAVWGYFGSATEKLVIIRTVLFWEEKSRTQSVVSSLVPRRFMTSTSFQLASEVMCIHISRFFLHVY